MKFFYKYNKFVNDVTSVIKILIFLINKILRLQIYSYIFKN